MRNLIAVCLLAIPLLAQNPSNPKLCVDDAIRIAEFYRLSAAIQDGIWPGWSKVPAPLLLETPATEFLTHHPAPPAGFQKTAEDRYVRPRQFPENLQATFPLSGPPAVMVVGEPASTASKTSTPWLFMVMHEHFHQLQWAQPGYIEAVQALGLSGGDTTGMWMLNYPFPYEDPRVSESFAHLRDSLLRALQETDATAFAKLARKYGEQRNKLIAQLSAADHKYLAFQLWQEGIARYTEVKAAEAAREYQPSADFAALTDYELFADYATTKRASTLDELKQADLATWKRTVVYSFGAAEGFLLDRIRPTWKDEYFKHMLSTDSLFEAAK